MGVSGNVDEMFDFEHISDSENIPNYEILYSAKHLKANRQRYKKGKEGLL